MAVAVEVLNKQTREDREIGEGTFEELRDELLRSMPIKAEGFLSAAQARFRKRF